MPGLDLTQLSSNWKKLQGHLQAEKTIETGGHASHALKRKRPVDGPEKPLWEKKIKVAKTARQLPKKSSRMGLATSKAESSRSGLNHSDDASLSNSLPNGRTNAQPDQINSGLHPTNRAGKYVSLDCEMVGTGPPPHTDNVLARVSMVNFHGEQLYDSYVRPLPKVEVKDYRTFISGILESHLHPSSARPFAEVQADVAKLLHGRILVGHALRNDLEVLLLSHPKRDIRDTARYAKWRKQHHGTPALRVLAREVLGLEIQTGEHSSVEDARAAMLLFRKEKAGFEEDVRRRYGQRRVQRVEGAEKKREGRVDGSVDDDERDESDDLDMLDGEVSDHFSDADTDAEAEEGQKNAPRAKKKKGKKKKRTKRK